MRTKNILILSLATASFLFAAPPTSGDIDKQVQVPKEVHKGLDNTIPSLQTEEVKPVMSDMGGKSVEVKAFKLTGAFHVSEDKLLSRIQSYAGKSHSFSELQKMTSLITKAYREEGYFVARAYIPKQDMKDGILEIAIIEGNYGDFKLTNSSLVDNQSVQEMLDDVKGDNVVSVNTLERAMLIINDTPGAKVAGADVMPGTKVGTSDFAIKTEATNPYNAYVIADNYGSKYTGRYRANVGLSANSPLGYGDKFGINGVISTETDLKNGKVYYNFPLMANGLRGEFSASKTSYELGDTYTSLDALGTSTTLEASLSYPIIRTRLESLYVTAALAKKKMEDEVRSTLDITKKEALVGSLGLNYTKEALLFGLNGKTTANISFVYGDLEFKDAADLAIDIAGANTNGNYSKIFGSIEQYLQLDAHYALTTSLRFQKALGNKNLDGSEDFSLGGAYGVRAFPDGEHSAENGYIVGAELFYSLPEYEGINHKASVFVDTGYATMENTLAGTESRHLSDVGLGYQAFYKEFFAKAQVARVIGGEKSTTEDRDSTRFLLQLGWVY